MHQIRQKSHFSITRLHKKTCIPYWIFSLKPQEGNESSEQLKSYFERIIRALRKLPEYTLSVRFPGNHSDFRIKTTKEKLPTDPYYNRSGEGLREQPYAHLYTTIISIVQDDLFEIKYREPYTIVANTLPKRSSAERLSVTSKIPAGETNIVDVIDNGITLGPKMTGDDVKTVVEFLEKAVAQHEENERIKALEIDRVQTATASAIRENLALLK